MAVSGATVLRKMKKLFDKLGVPDGVIKIRIVNRPGSVFRPSDSPQILSLGRARLLDKEDRIAMGIADADAEVVQIWGGALESSGLYEVTKDALDRAKLPGGGVLIYDRKYSLRTYEAGFTVQGVVSQWTLVCISTGKPTI